LREASRRFAAVVQFDFDPDCRATEILCRTESAATAHEWIEDDATRGTVNVDEWCQCGNGLLIRMERHVILLPIDDIRDRSFRNWRIAFGEEVRRFMSAARVSTKTPLPFDESEVTDRTKADGFPNAQKRIAVGPAVKRHAERIRFEQPPDF